MITPADLTERQIHDACRDNLISFLDAWNALGEPCDEAARQRICDKINARDAARAAARAARKERERSAAETRAASKAAYDALPGPGQVAEYWDDVAAEACERDRLESERRAAAHGRAAVQAADDGERRTGCPYGNMPREAGAGHWREWHRGHGCAADPDAKGGA